MQRAKRYIIIIGIAVLVILVAGLVLASIFDKLADVLSIFLIILATLSILSTAALVYLLHGRVADRPAGERRPGSGASIPAGKTPYAPDDFWGKAVGVGTPHRAQQGLIVQRLQAERGSALL